MVVITWRLAVASAPGPGWQQVESGSHLASGHDRVGAAAVAAGGLAVAHISTVNRPSTLLNGPLLEPQNEQRAAMAGPLLERLFP
jgi:hypothetical protein